MKLGKGWFIWKIRYCEDGDFARIAKAAVAAGVQHVAIKIAQGTGRYNIHPLLFNDLVPPVAAALRYYGIQVYGWHYVLGNDPIGEAKQAGKRMTDLNLDGYVIDAESEYKQPGKAAAARLFMPELRRQLPPGCPVGLSSYRFPTLHEEFPWSAFLPAVDFVVPQIYWMKATNAGAQLMRSYREYQNRTNKPFLPTGAAFHEDGWTARPEEIYEFYDTVKFLGLEQTGYNFWEWGLARTYGLWDTVAGLGHQSQPEPQRRWRSIVYGLRIRKAPTTQSPIVGALWRLEEVTELESASAQDEIWIRHERGWSCVQQPGNIYMELV